MSWADTDQPVVGVRIVDTTWATDVPLAGDVNITVDTNTRELLFYGEGEGETLPQRVEIQNVSVIQRRPCWTLDLNWRRPAFPAVILIAMSLWAFPMGHLPMESLGFELPTWLLKTSLWLLIALPLLLYRNPQQRLAIELAADQGVLIVEADAAGTALFLNL